MKFILLVSPLICFPTLIKREDAGLLNMWADKQLEKKQPIPANGEAPAKKDETSSTGFNLGELANTFQDLKKTFGKEVISVLLPFEFGVKQLERAKNDLKVALKDDNREEIIPIKQITELSDGLHSFWNGIKGSWNRLTSNPIKVAKLEDAETLKNLINDKPLSEPEN